MWISWIILAKIFNDATQKGLKIFLLKFEVNKYNLSEVKNIPSETCSAAGNQSGGRKVGGAKRSYLISGQIKNLKAKLNLSRTFSGSGGTNDDLPGGNVLLLRLKLILFTPNPIFDLNRFFFLKRYRK